MDQQENEVEEMSLEKMAQRRPDQKTTARGRMAREELVQEKIDPQGNKWRKVYFGGGAHFRNWLAQYQELGFEIEVEEIDSTGFRCFEESGERTHRIWLKEQPS
jgi:hypothetical protein